MSPARGSGLTCMTETLTVDTLVDAPASAVFAVLADPTTHAAIDGTGWVRESLDGQPITESGQMFRMAMYFANPAFADGHYEVANKVIAFEPDRAIGWAPGQAGEDGVVEHGGWTWHYELETVGSGQTRVTLTYDWSAVPATIREHIEFPPFPVEHLHNSLSHLAKLAVG